MDHLFGKLKHEAVKLKREAKKVAELESPIERKIREATSNQNWGCPNSVLYEITVAAQDYHDRRKIMKAFEEKLNSEPHRWRRLLKSLTLLEFIIKNCSEDVLPEFLAEQTKVRRLQNFHYSEDGKERGQIVRDKANAIIELVGSQILLRAGRDDAKAHRAKMVQEGAQQGNNKPVRQQHQSTSRASMEARFNEMKQKREEERERGVLDRKEHASECRERDLDADRDRRSHDSPREFSRDGYDIHIAPPAPDGRRGEASPNVMDIPLDSDSDKDEAIKKMPAAKISPRDPPKEAPQADLLDFGEPTANVEARASPQDDWASFSGAPASSGSMGLFSAAPPPAAPAPSGGADFDLIGFADPLKDPIAIDTSQNHLLFS